MRTVMIWDFRIDHFGGAMHVLLSPSIRKEDLYE